MGRRSHMAGEMFAVAEWSSDNAWQTVSSNDCWQAVAARYKVAAGDGRLAGALVWRINQKRG